MRYAILSDIHGNLDALESVLADSEEQSIDQYICLGDVVGYGPEPAECLYTLQKHGATIVAGNHDFAVAQKMNIDTFNLLAKTATLWTRAALDQKDIDYLANLPLVVEFDDFEIVHGTLYSPELFDYVQTSYDAHLAMQRMQRPLCFIGHSHIPVAFTEGDFISYSLDPLLTIDPDGHVIVNVGSVGQPRDRDPRSCYAIYDDAPRTVELRRVEYDVNAVVDKICQAGLPEPLGERLRVGR